MWVAKIKFSSKGTLIGTEAIKNKISLFGFPLSYSKEDNWVIVQVAGTIFGNAENKKKFIKDLKKDHRLVHLELNNDFLIGTIKEPIYTESLYNKDIFHIEPAFISEKGYETITIGSFDREKLTKIIKVFEEKYSGLLISIQNTKIKSLSVVKIKPELTDKQRNAMELAIKHGYYCSPRKIDLVKLSKFAGLSFSTYQVHLRKAEEKIMPVIFE